MDLRVDAHSPTPIRRPGAEPPRTSSRAVVSRGAQRCRGNWTASASRRTRWSAPSGSLRGAGTGRCMRAWPRRRARRSRGHASPRDATWETEQRQSSGEAYPGGGGRDMTLAMVAMWVLVGLLVGLLAGLVMKAGGYGRRWDILLALVGSVVWSGIAWLLEIPPTRAWSRRPASRSSARRA